MAAFDMTEQEQAVLQGLSEALSNQEIANRLFLSPSTINRHSEGLVSKSE